MKEIYLEINNSDIKNPPLKIEVADNFLTRFMGLMGRKVLPNGHGLLISPCNSVHMCFMRFAIDIVYIDENYNVLKAVKNLKPWVGMSICWKAWGVIELPTGSIEQYNISSGDKIFTSHQNHP